ncbi:ERCC4 domain-containing protein [Lentinula aff. lateritia]|uniref:ERCC4 domain-containing protein n=1 Tax=Lentinula aff. lateritia TaxID=2804960 RepID=A0ACC1TS81_9AGAR|nr:ERCC4 domain-containing protein [Lentinula aff. lateritia]
MPPKRPPCANPLFLKMIEDLRDAQEPESRRYMAYNKAAWSMKGYAEVLHRPEDALKVPHVGPRVVEELKARTASSSSSPQRKSLAKHEKAPGRPKKSKLSAKILAVPSAPNTSSVSSLAPAQNLGQPSLTKGDIFSFCYLNQNEIQVEHRRAAHVEIDLTSGPGLFIEFPRSCQHPVLTEIMSKMPQPKRTIGYLPMDIAIADLHFAKSTLPFNWISHIPAPLRPTISEPSAVKRPVVVDILAVENAQMLKKRKDGGLDPSRQQSTAGSWTISISESTGNAIRRAQMMPPPSTVPRVPQQSIASSSKLATRRTDSAPADTQRTKRARPRLSHAIPLPTVEMDIDIEDSYASTDRFELEAFDPVVIRSHEYDVVLVLDNREIKSGRDRSGIADGIRRQGVVVARRSLNIGDLCWIAKRKPQYCNNSEYDEIVLDCILERKRLDDLVQSIKDNRFHDQKFRLHNTAITKVYYLVEEYKLSREQDKSTFELAIDTVLSQTAIADKFQVKETRSINDTIDFYVSLNRQVVSMYKNKDLHVVPSQLVKRYSYLMFQKMLRRKFPERSYLLAYTTFHDLNHKSGFITVRETWARMLLCINGVSTEKAGVLIQRFPTPQSLYRACKQAEQQQKEDDEDERVAKARGEKPRRKQDIFIAKEFLKDFGGNSERKIGPALSTRIFDSMMQ